eukprot:scaffold14391_cov116-Isochrysis_galbana.AAC.3
MLAFWAAYRQPTCGDNKTARAGALAPLLERAHASRSQCETRPPCNGPLPGSYALERPASTHRHRSPRTDGAKRCLGSPVAWIRNVQCRGALRKHRGRSCHERLCRAPEKTEPLNNPTGH